MESSNFKIDFVGIGVFRSGTTWIAQCLREHPEICVPRIKEIEFFSKYYKKGVDWYKNQFLECSESRLKGEYSNAYLCDKDALGLIKKHFPEAKLIVCLRNPVDQVYSYYWWWARNFNKNSETPFSNFIRVDSEYVQQAFYHKYLKRYFESFGEEKIHVILFDDIESDAAGVIRSLYEFLEASPGFVPPSLCKKINPAAKSRFRLLAYVFSLRIILERLGLGGVVDLLKRFNLYDGIQKLYVKINRKGTVYPVMSAADKRRLQQVFREDIGRLEKLIRRDLSVWKK
mgnify:CR=1 FL=1